MRRSAAILPLLFPFFASIALAGDPPTVVATIAGSQQITSDELERDVEAKLLQERVREYEIRRAALDQLIEKRLISWKAQSLGITIDELLVREVSDRISEPAGDEVARAYETARGHIKEVPRDEGLRLLYDEMIRSRRDQRYRSYIASLKKEANVEIALAPPRVSVPSTGGIAAGPSTAPITIVEFSDFQCPYCARFSHTLRDVQQQYGGAVRVVFRHFPLNIHRDATRAAEAAACANEQGKFWQFADLLYANQKALSDQDLKRYAESVSLDSARFASCVDSGRHASTWKQDLALGQTIGVAATPAIFVNGRPIFGAVRVEDFTRVVDEELALARGGGATHAP